MGNMTSYTKPEVHNVSHRRQKTIEPWPRGYAQKFGEDRSHCSGDIPPDRPTDRQTETNRLTDDNTPHPYQGGVHIEHVEL